MTSEEANDNQKRTVLHGAAVVIVGSTETVRRWHSGTKMYQKVLISPGVESEMTVAINNEVNDAAFALVISSIAI